MAGDLNSIRARLEAKRQELRETLSRLRIHYAVGNGVAGLADGVEDTEEIAREMEEREEEESICVNQQALLDEIEHALQRLDEGTYGVCSECGQPIPEKRLEAIPWAVRDLACEASREGAVL